MFMFIKIYLISLFVFMLIDMVWLVIIARGFYAKHIGFLMSPQVNWIAAIIFYLLFVFGLVLFVITPALKANSWEYALLYGALFGLIPYATYDLTNLATIKDWPLLVTIIDLIWGTFIASSVSLISYFIVMKLGLS